MLLEITVRSLRYNNLPIVLLGLSQSTPLFLDKMYWKSGLKINNLPSRHIKVMVIKNTTLHLYHIFHFYKNSTH